MPSMYRSDLLAESRILVTGGGSGLGRLIAEACSAHGATVYICGRRTAVLEDTARELNAKSSGRVLPLSCDLRAADEIDNLVSAIWEDGPLTGLVNNAAGNFIARTETLSSRGFDAIAETVFRGSFLMTNACGRRWIEGKTPGAVVSILATWIWNGGPFTVPSAMSKAGVHAMTQSLAVEWARHGIRLNAVCPGAFPTPGAAGRLTPLEGQEPISNPMQRNGRPEELTNLVLYFLAPGSEFVTGQTIAIDGGGWQATGQNFAALLDWTDEEWAAAREAARAIDQAEKALRSAGLATP